MTKKQSKSEPKEAQQKNDSQSNLTKISNIIQAKWFSPGLFLILAMLYFAPHLSLNKIIMGTDDGPRGWHTVGNHGHGFKSYFDKWSPLNGGTANMERRFGRFINPTHVFHLIMPKYKARTLEYVFWTFVAGYFMFLFLQTLGISKLVACVCGLAFMYAPAFQSYIFAGHFARMEVIALLPGVMFFTERILKKANLLDIIGLPILLALSYYSEHVQLAYFVCIGMGFYFALRMIHMVFIKKEILLSEGVKRSGFFTAALIIGLLLTAMNTFPTIHHTNVTSKRAGGVDYEYASSFGLHNEEIFSLFEPDFIGWKEFYWGQNALKLNNEYFGVCFLLLAIMLFLFRKHVFKKYLFAGFFLFAVLFTLGGHTPLHKIIYHLLPGMKAFRAPSFMYIWFVLPGLVLAAYALDEILSYNWNNNPVLNKRLLVFIGIVSGLAFLYMIASGAFANFWYNSIYPAELQHERKYNALMHNMDNIKIGGFLTFLFIAVLFTIIYLKIKGIINQNLFMTIFLIIICIDLFRISRPFLSQCVKPKNYFTRQEKVEQSIERYLHQRDKSYYRVHSMLGDQKMYIPDLELTYIFDDFINKRYYDIVQIIQSCAYALQQQQYATNIGIQTRFRNALGILNTKYILTLSPLNISGIREVINSGGLRIYENIQSVPRFYLVDNILPEINTKEALFSIINKPDFKQNFAIVDKELWGERVISSITDSTIVNNVSVKTYDTRKGHTVLDITSNREQLLVVAENSNKGWTATVNEEPVDIFPVNYYAKGVMVPKGKSKIEFIYNSSRAVFWRKVTLISFIFFGIFSLFSLFSYIKKAKSS